MFGSFFCFIDLHVCFCNHTMLFFLLQLHNILEICSFLPHCFRSELLCLSWYLLCFDVNFCIFFCEEYHGIFIESNVITFGIMVIFTILILQNCEHQRAFYLLLSFSVSFFRDLGSHCRGCHLLNQLYSTFSLDYFELSNVSKICFSACLYVVYRKAIEFHEDFVSHHLLKLVVISKKKSSFNGIFGISSLQYVICKQG